MTCQICENRETKRTIDGVPGSRISICKECQSAVSAFRTNFYGETSAQFEKFDQAFQYLSAQRESTQNSVGSAYLRYLLRKYSPEDERLRVVRDRYLSEKREEKALEERIRLHKMELMDYKETSHIGEFLSIDELSETWVIPANKELAQIRKFSDILDFEIVENGQSVQRGTAGAAMIGALIGGVSGAIIGNSVAKATEEMVSSLLIRVTLNSATDPVDTIPLLRPGQLLPIPKNDTQYQAIADTCGKITAVLRFMMTRSPIASQSAAPCFVADELIKLKGLVDVGVLTQEEFDLQKKRLLNL